MKTVFVRKKKKLGGLIFSPDNKNIDHPIKQSPIESSTKRHKEGTAEVLHISSMGGFERL